MSTLKHMGYTFGSGPLNSSRAPLYSAAPFDVGDSDHDNAALLGGTHADELVLDDNESGLGLSADPMSAQDYSIPELVLEPTDEFHGLVPERTSFGQEIVFIDSGVEGWQLMLDDLRSSSDDQTNLSIVLLDSQRDGIEQISETLSNRRNVAAIHLISHGDAGQLQLGSTTLASQNISAYAAEISSWNDSLADGADLLIYGCNLASNADGRFLAESLGELCNCNVAASDDLTGHSSLGGDWILEYATGDVTTDLVFSEEVRQDWFGVLSEPALWLTTRDDVSGGGTPGIETWAAGEIIQFGDPNLSFGSGTTNGEFSSIINFDSFDIIGDSNVDIDAIHHVSTTTLIAGGSFTLEVGDILLSTTGNETLDAANQIVVSADDVFVYRQSNNMFYMLLDNLEGGTGDVQAVSLVEATTTIGTSTTDVTAGNFLITYAATDTQIHEYSATSVGLGLTSGSATLLVDGIDIGIMASDKIEGIELIESQVTIGGTILKRGSILITLDQSANGIGTSSISVADEDIFYIDLSQTGTNTAGDAGYFFDGSNVYLSTNPEDPHGIALLDLASLNNPPTVSGVVSESATEDDAVFPVDLLAGASDTDTSDTLNVSGLTLASGDDGGVTIGVNSLSVDPNAYNSLAAGQSEVITYSYNIIDGNGGSVAQTVTITITGQNDAPVLTSIEGTNAAYTENGTPTQITNSIAIADVDDTENDSATIQITGNYTAGDELLFTDTATITHTWNAGSGTLTLAGADSLANYAAAMRSVAFENTGDDPTALTRTISFSINDGDDVSNTLSRDVDVVPVNDAPVVTLNPTTLPYASGARAIDPTITVTDVDNTQLESAVVRFGPGFLNGEDTLVFVDQLGITGSLDGNGRTLTLSGVANVADYETALRSIQYENVSPTPTFGTLVVQFTVDDGSDVSVVANRTIDIIDDAPPQASDDSGTVAEAGFVIMDLAANDSDNNNLLDPTSIVIISGPANGSLLDNGDGTVTYTHNGSETLTDSFVYTIKDDLGLESNQASAVLTVTPVNDAPAANIIPSAYGVNEDVLPTPLGGISISDVDAGGNDLEVTVSVNDGSVTLISMTGLTITGGANGTDTVTVLGNSTDLNNALATLRYQPDLNFFGSDLLTLTVDDLGNSGGGSLTDFDTATIIVAPVNDDPTIGAAVSAGAIEDDSAFVVDMLTGANDIEGDSLNVSGLTLASGDDTGVTIGINSLSIDPNAYNSLAVGQSAVIVYNYNIVDGNGGSVAQTATITITGQNDGPTVSGVVTGGGTEDDAVFPVDLLAGASDADTTDTLNVSGLTLSSGDDSGVTIGVNSLSVDPNAYNSLAIGESEVIVYTYNIIDGEGGSVAQTATITITGENDGPTVSGVVTNGGTEDDAVFPVDLLAGASDADTTDTLNVTGLTLSSGDDSGVTIGVNSLSVDPNAYNSLAVGQSEIITYSYNISDGNGGSASQTATITITGMNDAPVITSDGGGPTASINVAENAISVTTLTATDLDLPADTLTYSITGGADQTQFAIEPASGVLTFISPTDFEAPTDADTNNTYEVVVTVTDGKGGTDLQSITVTVLDGNEAPTTTGIPDLTFGEDSIDGTVDLLVAFDDPEDADTDLVYTIESVSNPGLFDSVTINGSDEIVLDFAANQNGSALITVRATDTGGLFVETTVRVDVDPINDDPIVSSPVIPIVVNEDASDTILDLDSVFADVDILTNGDILTYSIVSNSNATLVDPTLAGSNLILSYQDDQFGASTIVVRATDSFGQSVDETISITGNPINDAPTLDIPISLVTVAEDDPDSIFDLSTVFGDIDDSALIYTVVSNTNPTLVDASVSGNLLTFGYLPNQFGVANIVVRATDATGDSIEHAIDVTVNSVNDVPVLGNNSLSINESQSATLGSSDLSATDIESADPGLTFTVSNVSGGQFELSTAPGTAIFTFTQGQVAFGQVVFVDDGDEFAPSYEVVVDDGLATNGPWPVNITFTNVNDSPVGSSDSFTSLVGDNLFGSGLLSNDFDADSSFLTAILNSGPSNGSLTLNLDGSFVYSSDPGFDGVDSFSYLVNDGTTNSDPTTVVITVLNAAPIVTPPTIGLPSGGDGDDEDLEDILLPANTSSDSLTGADVAEGRSIPIAKISFNGTSTGIESVFRANVTNAKIDDPNFVWAEAFTNDSTEAETAYKNPRTTSKDLLDKAGWFWQALDQNSRQLQFEGNLPEFLLGSSAAMASTVTVGYLMWLVKGGQIMAAVMANLPAWSLIDPLPILNAMIDDDEDEDSLQTIIEQGEDELQSNS